MPEKPFSTTDSPAMLIERQLAGTATDAERETLAHWLAEHPSDTVRIAETRATWWLGAPAPSAFDPRASLSRLHTKQLGETDRERGQQRRPRVPFALPT